MKNLQKILFLAVCGLWISTAADAMNSNSVFNNQKSQSSSVSQQISGRENVDPNAFRPTVKAYDGLNKNPLLNFKMTEAEKIQGNPDNIVYHLTNQKKVFTRANIRKVVKERISKDMMSYNKSKFNGIVNKIVGTARKIGKNKNGNRLYWAKIQNYRKYNKNFLHPIICSSVSEEWKQAAQEWKVTNYKRVEEDICICGKEEIKDIYKIRNRLNGNELYPIGSRCINKFKSKKMNEDVSEYKRISKKVFNRISKLKETIDKGELIKFSARLFSEELIRYLNQKGVLDDNENQFLLDMRSKRRNSEQKEQIDKIIDDYIVPYVKKLPQNEIIINGQMLEQFKE